MNMPRRKPSLVSLFAGCGGSSLGYQQAGYDVRLAVEWDAGATAAYRCNFPKTLVWEGDICDLSGAEALKLAGVGPGELDVLDGSPPCQGFSTAGKRRFADRRNRLFEEYVRLLEAFRPRAFVMENVSGLVKGKMKLAFAEMTIALKNAGYRVSCRLLNAWWYGVPQDRRRLIWIGMRDDLGVEPSHPAPTQRRPITVTMALDAAGITSGWRGAIKNAIHYGEWRSSQLPSPMLNASQPPVVLIEHHPGYKDAAFHEGLAPTLASGRKTRLTDGNELPRYLTIDEAKILQGFPDTFDVNEYRLIGNSVAPPMAEAVGRHVMRLLRKTAPCP